MHDNPEFLKRQGKTFDQKEKLAKEGGVKSAQEVFQTAPSVRGNGQTALPFMRHSRFERSDFVAAPSNAAARIWVLDPEARWQWPEGRLVLWGDEGTGKTHLLSVWSGRHGAPVIDGTRLCNADVAALSHEKLSALALDNADCVSQERDLLHLINMSRERRISLLMTARTPPARWSVALPDLVSRLRATTSVPIGSAEEALLRRLFLRLLAERQIVVGQSVTDWLLRRLPRNAGVIRDMTERLDNLALESGGKVTRKLAQEVLEQINGHSDTL